jgi:Tfp pilus assembly protein PilN
MRPVNLVPQDQRRRTPRESSGKGAYVALGVLAVLLGMVVAYVLTSNTVTERQSAAETARVEADRLEAEAARKGSFSDFALVAQTRLQSVAGVAGTRFDWERFMRELSRVMPAGSWLQTADASVTGAQTDPANAGTLAAAGTSPSPTASLTGCTPTQSEAARMMVRLRQLHRVADVELRGSTREGATDAAGASLDSCGSNYKFDLLVTFSPPSPAGEAPRGEPRVPVSLGGGS